MPIEGNVGQGPGILKMRSADMAPSTGASGGNGDADRDSLDLFRLIQMGGRGATNITAEFGTALKDMDLSKPETVEKVKELYADTVNEAMSSIYELVQKDGYNDEKNMYPYDFRTAEFMIDNINQALTNIKRQEWMKKNEDGEVLVAELEQDAVWLNNFLHTIVAQSSALPYKFDVVMQLQQLKEARYNAFVNNDNMEAVMSLEVDGMELTPKQKEARKNKNLGVLVPAEYKKLIDENNNEINDEKPLIEGEVNLREVAIKMFAASYKLRMGLAATSQATLSQPEPGKNTFMGDKLTKFDTQFYKALLFDANEGMVITPYLSSDGEHTREYTTILESALLKNAYFRLKDIKSNTTLDDSGKMVKIDGLIREVKAEALNRKTNWKKRQDRDFVSMLATLITQQGFIEDFSYGHAVDYCYGYKWSLDAANKPQSIKAREISGIYTWGGDFPSLGYAQRKFTYDGLSNSCTKFLPPTSRAGREEVALLPIMEMKHFDITQSRDEFLGEMWSFLFGTDAKSVNARKELGYKSLNSTVSAQLQEWAYEWKLPYNRKFLENPADRGKDEFNFELEIPHLMPSSIGNIATFWDSVTLENTKLNFGGKSIRQELINGKETYEIDWKRVEVQAHSRWKVDCDMASRYMKILIEPVEEEKDPILGLIMAGPGTFGPKEVAKRLRLSKRDDEDSPPTVHEIAMIPYIVVMACAEKHGLSNAYAWQRASEDDIKSGTCAADRFFIEMAYWKRALKWLASDRPAKDRFGSDLDYGNEMALLAEFYEAVISRAFKASAEESFILAKDNHDKTAGRLNNLGHLNKGTFRYSIDTQKPLVK